MEDYTFKFKNIAYEITDKWDVTDRYQFDTVEEGKDFQIRQFKYLIEVSDFTTMENRITSQLLSGHLRKT